MCKISCVFAREIMDSRGNPTVEVDVMLEDGTLGRAAVPSGASTGEAEALELRDGDKSRYMGKGVLKAVKNVNDIIAPAVSGRCVTAQVEIDTLMIDLDGTENKGKLGANAILGVSMAVAKAAAAHLELPLFRYLGGTNACIVPIPFMNVLNGGAHADNSVDIQEFMLVPAGARNFSEALRMGVETFHNLKKLLKDAKYNTSVGDEGGFAPMLKSNEEAIEFLVKAIEKAGYAKKIFIGIDCAASGFYEKDKYVFKKSDKRQLSSEQLIDLYAAWKKTYPLISIEDGLAEEDWDGWKMLTEKLGKNTQIIGDDIFVTNTKRLAQGIEKGVANSILIKLNQIGTVTETLRAVEMAKNAHYTAVISHRSGETEDATIADLAVATNCGMIKTGSASRTDRMAKYNQLLRIEEMLGKNAAFLGTKAFTSARCF